MIKQHLTFFRNCLVFSDITIISFLFPLALSLHNRLGSAIQSGIFSFIYKQVNWNLFNYASILILIAPTWYFSLMYSKAYSSFRLAYVFSNIRYMIQASILIIPILSLIFMYNDFKVTFFDTEFHFGYSLILVYPALCAVILSVYRIFFISIFRIIRAFGYNQRHIVVVGTGPRAIEHIGKVKDHPQWGLNIKGIITLQKEDQLPKELKTLSILGTINELDDILKKNPIDEVFFIVPRKWLEKIDNAVMICDLKGITVHIAIDLFNIKVSKSAVSNLGRLPILSFNTTSTAYSSIALKRIFDIVTSLTCLILFMPFTLFIIILIRLESKGPIIFSQVRCSKNGRTFKMLKFRTMVANAETLKHSLKDIDEQPGPVFKMKQDPRITKIGKFLRKTSLDEMPQLINVLLGDMSIVGPRPPIPKEVDNYEAWQRRKLSMRSGITCLWQVSGRNDIPFEQWMELDLEYIDNWSLLLDLKIILKTIPAVLFAKGNHG